MGLPSTLSELLGRLDRFFLGGGWWGALRWLNEGNWVKGSMSLFYSGEEGFLWLWLLCNSGCGGLMFS